MKKITLLAATAFLLLFTLSISFSYSQTGWLQVSPFGTNPGNLLMYRYVPTNIPANAPLVVVLHGCTQTASGFEGYAGWDTLSNHYKFYVIHAQQQSANNSSSCFNWFQATDYSRNQGEAYSIKQMMNYMKNHFSIDSSRVFVTGLSAGACMTAVMMGAYPEVFNAGAIMAGAPYKSATDATSAYQAMLGNVTKTPSQWGDLVRSENTSFTGSFPRVAIFQGTIDGTVKPVNARELMKQWTNVHKTDTIADSINTSFYNNNKILLKQYHDSTGNTVVETYMISTMDHGISVYPGTCFQQGGTGTGAYGTYSYNENFYSSFWAAEFFGLINNPYSISGPITVTYGQSSIVFSVPNHSGSTYQWIFPAGVAIISGQGTNQVTVNWGNVSGFVTVNETNSSSCIIGPVEVYVTATINTGINESNEDASVMAFPNQAGNTINIKSDLKSYNVFVYDFAGRMIQKANKLSNNTVIHLPDNLQQGIYMLRIIAGNKAYSRKFLKM
jgi:poly(hydroxyalkanoate) depolymerase family esterase